MNNKETDSSSNIPNLKENLKLAHEGLNKSKYPEQDYQLFELLGW